MSPLVVVIDEFNENSSPTGRLSSELVRELRNKGNRVFHLTAIFHYKPGGLAPRRLFNLAYLGTSSLIVLPVLALLSLVSRQRAFIVCNSTPPLMHLWTALICKPLRIGHLAWIQDMHPEFEARILERKGWSRGASFLRAVERIVLPLSSAIVAMDEAMVQEIRTLSRGRLEATAVPPWGTFIAPAQPLRAPETTLYGSRLLYAGNYGAAHDLTPLAQALREGNETLVRSLTFTFVGMNEKSQQRIRDTFAGCIARLEFLPRFRDLQQLCVFMREFDYGIVSLASDRGGLSCPSKALTYLSQGLPIFYVGPQKTLAWSFVQDGWGVELHSALTQPSTVGDGIARRHGETFPDPSQSSLATMVKLVNCARRELSPFDRELV